MAFAVRSTLPLKVSVPLLTESPSVTAPPSRNAFASARAAVESLERRPALKVTVPEPRAVSLPASIAPALKVTPPLKSLDPLRVSTAVPVFARAPAPVMRPEKTVEVPPLRVSVLPWRLTRPAPAIEAICSSVATFRLPAAFTVTAMLLTSALPPLSVRIPSFTAKVPPKVFTPLNSSSAVPSFTRL